MHRASAADRGSCVTQRITNVDAVMEFGVPVVGRTRIGLRADGRRSAGQILLVMSQTSMNLRLTTFGECPRHRT